jgi:hypothetical protein
MKTAHRGSKELAAEAGRALRRAARVARQTARAYGTPIYVWKNGKVVALMPERAGK